MPPHDMYESHLSSMLVDDHVRQSDAVLSSDLPATPDGDVGASCPKGALSSGLPSVTPNLDPSYREPSLPQQFPLPSAPHQDVPTPLDDHRPDLGSIFAGGVLPSTDVSLPAPPIVKTSHGLRLPSFDLLGIAAPHPDRIPLQTNNSFSALGAGPLSKPEDPLHVLSPALGPIHQIDGSSDTFTATTDHLTTTADHFTSTPDNARAKTEYLVPIVTPPTEPGTFNWGSFVNVRPTGLGSPPSSDPGTSPNLTITAAATSPGTSTHPVALDPALSSFASMAGWVPTVEDKLTSESGCRDLSQIKVLSHALPCPSMSGHLFGQLIATLHDRTPANTAWINVFHAVPGRFTLSDLPKSPPSTPGPAVGGDNYFTSKVFDSAVAIPDYQLDSKLLPPSPRPVVQPGSVNISIVERYIPPTNTNEYAEMFVLNGRSLLHDRLVELSPENGLLLFIYPTKTGARTFMQEYLGPILDPLLRSITVVHDLSSDLGKSLGQMSAVPHLDEYVHLKSRLERFCREVGDSELGDRKAKYEIIHAAKEELVLQRSAWADDWWIKQEKPRVRETVTKYFRKTKKLPESEMTGTHLIQEVLDGVAHRKYSEDDGARAGPTKGVEIGVFIVKKSK